ncbi:hypothetical protein [Larkinella soli]|uniref:hypothetical protein n=1 Tax=Larkinella soli TaxID=1770527 RepID=UPI000FFBED29|nr:hypothetical protein [Larkinella soli]
MKTPGIIIGLFLMAASCDRKEPWANEIGLSDACPEYDTWRKDTDLQEVAGRVVNEADTSKTSTWLYILGGDNTRYFACNLPETVRKTGTYVVFNAEKFAPPANVRLAGVPIKLTRLRVAP